MKTTLHGFSFYTGPVVSGFVYGVADRFFDPETDTARLGTTLGCRKVARVRQVHGDRIVTASEALKVSGCEADAIIAEASQAALIRVADCVPVLLLDPTAHRAAAIHAGWRGTFAEIVTKTVARFEDPTRLIAYIGPAIGSCCYEIGVDLATKFRERFGIGPWLIEAERPRLHLALLNAEQMTRAGVKSVTVEEHCTRHADDLHSFRRDGQAAGRLAAFVFVV